MSYSRKETKILTDYHRQYGRRYLSIDDRDECMECGQGISNGVLCDECRYREREPLELLEDKIAALKSATAGTEPSPDYLRMIARVWWEGYFKGAGLEWEEQDAGYRLINELIK